MPQQQPQIPGQQGNQNQANNAAGFVIYPDAGGFLYRGTEAQHERVKALVTELRDLATQELIVVEFYKLKHAKAEDVANLPPTFISTAALDLFIDENLEYARRLIRAGVPVELHVHPGAYHGFDVFTQAPVALEANRVHVMPSDDVS